MMKCCRYAVIAVSSIIMGAIALVFALHTWLGWVVVILVGLLTCLLIKVADDC